MCMAPSPSTRESVPTCITWPPSVSLWLIGSSSRHRCGALWLVPFGFSPERFRRGVERPVDPQHLTLAHAEREQPGRQGRGVGRVPRAEAAIAAARERGAQGAAARLRHRAQAGCAVRDGDAHRAAPFAFDTYAVGRDPWLAALDRAGQHLQQLVLVDRTAAVSYTHLTLPTT